MTRSPTLKIAGHALSLGMPLLTPIGVALRAPWLAPLTVFGLLPVLGLLIGEDRSLPPVELFRSRIVMWYLQNLPRIYAFVWLSVLLWAGHYASQSELTAWAYGCLIVSVGIASAVAVCTAHELMHRRASIDRVVARVMNAACLYGHMGVEHFHHHATLGDAKIGATAPRGMAVYEFAARDYVQGLANAWSVEETRLRRGTSFWWRNQVLQDYALAAAFAVVFWLAFGVPGAVLFVGQAVFAIFVFEVITYVHHYGLSVPQGEAAGPEHAWAHHCWITNCLTFNNTYHSDHHMRPRIPYYQLHAMYGVPHLPASYFTMFCVALVPPLWYRLMNPRLEAVAQARKDLTGEIAERLQMQHCR